MENFLPPFDCEGKKIIVGDIVLFVNVTDNLLKNLPNEDKEAIVNQKGKYFRIISFDKYGYAEIEFEYEHSNSEITFHTIWVEPSCLKKESEDRV